MSNRISYRQHAVKSDENKEIPRQESARTDEGNAFSRLVVQIFRLNGMIMSIGDALAEPYGQTSARWRVLAAAEDSPVTIAQIARRWGMARQSVQRVANAVVKDELAVYIQNPKHRRAQLLELTPKGRALLQEIQDGQAAWANQLGKEIGEADLRQAEVLLSKVLEAVLKK